MLISVPHLVFGGNLLDVSLDEARSPSLPHWNGSSVNFAHGFYYPMEKKFRFVGKVLTSSNGSKPNGTAHRVEYLGSGEKYNSGTLWLVQNLIGHGTVPIKTNTL